MALACSADGEKGMDGSTWKLKSAAPSRARPRARVLFLLVLLSLAAVGVEHWRGQWALRAWKKEMSAKGEAFEVRELWPAASAIAVEYSNQLARAIEQLPQGLDRYAGQLSGIVDEKPGLARRGSQEPRPPWAREGGVSNTWQALETTVQQAQPALGLVRQLMRSPPAGVGYDILERLTNNSFPNYVNTRRAAQALEVAALCDLHGGNLAGTLENLEALSAFTKLHAEDPTLVHFMIRIAITGLSLNVCWDALQARGWTEQQLMTLQRACQAGAFLEQMPRSIEAERAVRLQTLGWFRSHSYEEWIARHAPIYAAFGGKLPAWETMAPVRLWRQWVFHPVWCFAWADQEELHYLRHVQTELTLVRQASRQGGLNQLDWQLVEHYRHYRAPVAAWRFYGHLPLVDHVAEIIGSTRGRAAGCPYPDLTRAWQITFKNLTLQEMVRTAVALKRYELRHGQPPASLAVLVPEYMADLPHDFMDGQPLRYRLKPDGSFLLYSVGENGSDDGGNPAPEAAKVNQSSSPWEGRDLVWPQLAARTDSP
jgi:hypothetical protein